jgi:hypothetical protein
MRDPAGLADLDVMRKLAIHAARRGVEIDVTTNAERKATVLRHPDLAARLCEAPMRCSSPERWSGFIAPEMTATGPNTSPYRAQVVAIYEEALRREQEGTR